MSAVLVTFLSAVAMAGASMAEASDGGNGPKAGAAASDEESVPPDVAKALSKAVALKSAALKHATVKVHRAYEYRGPSEFKLNEKGKLIAIDIGVRGYTQHFKIWDLDVTDGQTNEDFGSDPEVAFLDAQGKFLAFSGERIDFKKPIRLLLVYAVPRTSRSIKLGYWGQELTPTAVPLERSGPALPKRQ